MRRPAPASKARLRLRRLALEGLEPRTLMAVLPPATINGRVSVAPEPGNDSSPSVVIDPSNPQKLVAVWTRDDPGHPLNNSQTAVFVEAAYSINGGQNWSQLSGLPNTRIDFNQAQNNGARFFSQVTDASVAFGPNNTFYLLSSPHAGDYSSGEILLQKFDFTSSAPVETGVLGGNPVYRWTQDAAFKPTLAVDANRPSFVDFNSQAQPYIQSDPFVGNVYVAWGTNNNTGGINGANPNTIRMVASSDMGATFTDQQVVNSNQNFGNERDSSPRLVVSQGRPPDPAVYGAGDAGVLGGQVSILWDDSNTNANATPPTDRIVANRVADGGVDRIFTAAGGPINEATDPGNNLPHIPTPTPFTQAVAITDPNFIVSNLDVTVNAIHNNLSELRIELISPLGTTITLLNNHTNADNTNNNNVGAGGSNLGSTNSGQFLGTVFDDQAIRSLVNNGGGPASTGHFRPEVGSLSAFQGLAGNSSAISGTWTLRFTDFRHDANLNPSPALLNWSLNFTSGLHPGQDIQVATTTVRGAVNNNAYPLNGGNAPASPDRGIGPGAVIASDNTLGAYSPHQGRLYVAYVDRSTAASNPADNTDIKLATSDDGGMTWQKGHGGGSVNDDIAQVDGFSEGDRAQFQPAVAVDQATGTLVVSYLDARNDAARARVATYLATSIDGGASFGKQVFANAPDQAIDAITHQEIVRGPIPDNQSAGNPIRDGAFAFGDHQGLAVLGGQVYPAWASNLNGGANGQQTLNVTVARAVIAAGPRVVGGTMGPVGEPGDTLNAQRAADGGPTASTIRVTFDRPVDPATFTAAEVKVFFHDANPADGFVPINPATIAVTPVVAPGDPNNNGHFGYTTFNVTFPPQAGVGTYSYEIGPDVSNRIPATVSGQGATIVIPPQAATGLPLRIPTSGTGGTGTSSDVTTSTIVLAGHPNQTIQNLAIDLSLTHTRVGDLTITLTALDPNGVPKAPPITLYSNASDNGQNFIGTKFTDAGQPLFTGVAPYSGSFQPASPLSVLNGSLLDGTYTLTITDNQPANFGQLTAWAVEGTTVMPGVVSRPGSAMDQNANAILGEPGDVFAAPQPLTNPPTGGAGFFNGPYNPDTLPLIVPGPHVVSTFAHHADGSAPTGGLVTDAGVDGVDVAFDRDMNPATFSGAAVTRVMGPAGLIAGPFTFTQDPLGDPARPDQPGHARTFRIGFPATATQVLSGTYTVTFGPGLQDTHGDALDINLNAGLYILDPTRNPNGATTQVTALASDTTQLIGTPPAPAAFPLPIPDATLVTNPDSTTTTIPGVLVSTLNVTDDFSVRGLTLQLDITHPNDPDLEATLIAPDGTAIKLFTNVGNNPTHHANFTNTIFSDAARTPIQNGPPPFFVGPFNPQQSLTTGLITGHLVNGVPVPIRSAGTWKLVVQDDAANGQAGTLNKWSLTFTKDVPNSGLGESVADLATADFRIFTMAPTNRLASSVWTAVGPASIGGGGGGGPEGGGAGGRSGRIGGIAVDPSDPSGNTVYIGGASGGIWKTTNFLDPGGPTYIPLTDFGPTFAINIGGIAIFPRNNDPNQSIIFAATGEGDTGTTGVGIIRSMDGGATWTLLDSTNNTLPFAAPPGSPAGTPVRDHAFVGSTAFKVVVDPKPSPGGGVIVYAVLSGNNGGIWVSNDTGQTWGRVNPATGARSANLAGNATDLVLDPASGIGGAGNLQIAYAAIRGVGVFQSTDAGQSWSQVLGGIGDPLIQDATTKNPIPVTPGATPNGGFGRLLLAKPFTTGDPAQDLLYEGWLYAAVMDTSSHFQGLYLTKDFGQNWTKVGIPTLPPIVTGGVASPQAVPTNDPTKPDYDVGGGPAGTGLPAQGNYDFNFAIDPTNPNVLYMGGTADGQPTGFIRIDVTGVTDPHALVPFNNQGPDGGLLQLNTNGNTGASAPPLKLKDPTKPVSPQPLFNLIRNPNAPFSASTTVKVGNAAQFNNSGAHAKWIPFDIGGTDQHRIVTFVDPLTHHARLIIGDDQGVYSAVDNNGTFDLGIGTAAATSGSRNGNLQITQFYYGAAQPSSLAAQVSGALFYGSAQDNGGPISGGGLLTPGDPGYGNISWGGPGGDATGVATDPQGLGTQFQYWWPCCGGNGTDFFQVDGVGRVFGLIQQSNPGPVPDPQWPSTGGSNFAVNPLTGQQILISSQAGRIFSTENQGFLWSEIGHPTALDSSYAPALAYGAPDPLGPGGGFNLDDFLYAGTLAGHIFVTQDRGGSGSDWTNISTGLDGSAIQAIIADPTRGSHRAYAVTAGGVFLNANSIQVLNGPAPTPWTNITGNLFQVIHNDFGDAAFADTAARYLTSLQVDWRYVIPDDPTDPNSATHPILYVGGEGGVFRSLDEGQTWSLFPNVAFDGSPQDGGYLPVAHVTDLKMAVGAINPATGRAEAKPGDPNVLLASTYGRGSFTIRLAPIVFPNTATQPNLLTLDVPNGVATNNLQPKVTGFSEQTAFGNVVTVNLIDQTVGDAKFGQVIGHATTDATGHFTVQVDANSFLGTNGLVHNGTKTLGVQAVDGSGTAGNIATLNFDLLTTPPPPPAFFILDPGSDTGLADDTGEPTGAEVTRITTPVFDIPGGLPAPATVELLRRPHGDTNPNDYAVVGTNAGGAAVGVVQVVDTGGGTTPTPVPDGVYDYVVRQLDAAGNMSLFSTPVVVTIDTGSPQRPSDPKLSPADNHNNRTANTRPTLVGTLAPEANPSPGEPPAFVQIVRVVNGSVTVLGVGLVDVGGNYQVPITSPLADASYTVQARAIDVAGNIGPLSNPYAFAVSSAKPPVSTIDLDPRDDTEVGDRDATPTPGAESTRIAQPRIIGQAGSGLTIDLLQVDPANPNSVTGVLAANVPVPIDLSGVAQYSITPQAPLPSGTYTVRVQARDDLGNASLSPPLTLTIRLQGPTTAPTLFLSPDTDTGIKGDNVTSVRRPKFIGHADPGALIDLIDPANPGQPKASGQAGADGNFAITLSSDQLNGTFQVAARSHDIVGNAGPSSPTLPISIVTTAGDYFGDGKASLAIFRPSTAAFAALGATGAIKLSQFGAPGLDIPIAGDFNGDGRNDFAIYRPSTSQFGVLYSSGGATLLQFGAPGSVPVPGNYDGPGKTDFAAYDPRSGTWAIFSPNTNSARTVSFGAPGDVPIPADYDGDGKTDIAVYRPSTGQFFIINSRTNTLTIDQVGAPNTDVPIAVDFDGDGKADPGTFRLSTADWTVHLSKSNQVVTVRFGQAGDLPVPADYDGDGVADLAIYRQSQGLWGIIRTSAGGEVVTFVGPGDLAIPEPTVFRTPAQPLQAQALSAPAPDLGRTAALFSTAAAPTAPTVVPPAAVPASTASTAPAATRRLPAQASTSGTAHHSHRRPHHHVHDLALEGLGRAHRHS